MYGTAQCSRLRAALARLDRQVGYRGTFLAFFAVLDWAYGFSLLFPPAEALRSPSFTFLGRVMPIPVWGMLWLAVAVVLTVGVFVRRDRWAFAAATGLKCLFGLTYLLGWLVFHVPRGWTSAVIWLVLAAVVMRISGWPEPEEREPSRKGAS